MKPPFKQPHSSQTNEVEECPSTQQMIRMSGRSIRMLRLPQVCDVTGLGRAMIYHLEARARFPKRVQITARTVGWIEHEVQEWLMKRIEHSRGQVPD